MFTAATVIAAARQRVGNRAISAPSELKVSDADVLAEMRDGILACARAFGASASSKEVTVYAPQAPTIATPAAPTLTPALTGGTLPTGTYGYRVTAAYLGGETAAGTAATAAVTGPTGSVLVGWAAVPDADGYHVYGRVANGRERRLATLAAGVLTWTDTGAAVPGSGMPPGSTVPTGYLQHLPVTALGADVLEITDVLRSAEHVGDAALRGSRRIDPLTDMTNDSPFGIAGGGYQDAVVDLMVAQERYRHVQQFGWDEVYLSGARHLRLMPPPTSAEVLVVTYVTATGTVESLPDEARNAMELDACRSMLECMLNRFNGFPQPVRDEQMSDRREWARVIERQRNRYLDRFRAALGGRGA